MLITPAAKPTVVHSRLYSTAFVMQAGEASTSHGDAAPVLRVLAMDFATNTEVRILLAQEDVMKLVENLDIILDEMLVASCSDCK